jgi:hypothetical protein
MAEYRKQKKNNPLGRLNVEKLHFWCAAAAAVALVHGSERNGRMVIKIRNATRSPTTHSTSTPPFFGHHSDRDERCTGKMEMGFLCSFCVVAIGHEQRVCVWVYTCRKKIELMCEREIKWKKQRIFLHPKIYFLRFFSDNNNWEWVSCKHFLYFFLLQFWYAIFLSPDDAHCANLRLIYNLWCCRFFILFHSLSCDGHTKRMLLLLLLLFELRLIWVGH